MGMLTAWVSRKMVNTQLNRLKPPSSPTMVGMVVATMVLSTAAMKVAMTQAASTRDRPLVSGRSCTIGWACEASSGMGVCVLRRFLDWGSVIRVGGWQHLPMTMPSR